MDPEGSGQLLGFIIKDEHGRQLTFLITMLKLQRSRMSHIYKI